MEMGEAWGTNNTWAAGRGQQSGPSCAQELGQTPQALPTLSRPGDLTDPPHSHSVQDAHPQLCRLQYPGTLPDLGPPKQPECIRLALVGGMGSLAHHLTMRPPVGHAQQ